MYAATKLRGINMRTYLTMTSIILLLFALITLTAGCATKYVRLTPTSEVRSAFMDMDIDPAKYAFFTTGPDSAPEAILLIKNEYLGDFDSSGWTLRDKQTIMDMLKNIADSASEGRKYGFPVKTEKDGVTKGLIFTGYRHGKVLVDEEEGVFRVATPAMMDTGGAMFKRSKCSISVCN